MGKGNFEGKRIRSKGIRRYKKRGGSNFGGKTESMNPKFEEILQGAQATGSTRCSNADFYKNGKVLVEYTGKSLHPLNRKPEWMTKKGRTHSRDCYRKKFRSRIGKFYSIIDTVASRMDY